MGEPIRAFATTKCLCGAEYTLPREEVASGEGITRWRCSDCKRRFVLVRTPADQGKPDDFWPVFLEQVPSTGDTRDANLDLGIESPDKPSYAEAPPPQLNFHCRCGRLMIAYEWMYHRTGRCPSCSVRLVLALFYDEETKAFSIQPIYREEGASRSP